MLVCVFAMAAAGAEELPRTKVSVPFEEVVWSQSLEEAMVSLRLAVEDIEEAFGTRYMGEQYLKALEVLEGEDDSAARTAAFWALQRLD